MATETDPLRAIEDILEKVGKLVKEEAESRNSAKGTTSRRRDTILEHLQELVKWASVIASANDFAKVAVDTFAKLLEYEVTRKKNSIEFVVVYHGFASTLSLVRYLRKTDLDSNPGDEINGFFDRLKETMEEFWTLAQVYVQAPRFARFIKAMSFEQKLKDIVKQNDDIQKSISLILQGYTAVSTTEIRIDIKEIKSILSVIQTFHDPTTGPEKKALKEAGDLETILNDDEKLTAVAKVFGERLTSDTKKMLQTDLQTLLDDKKQVMIDKLDQVTVTITTKMAENHGEIMHKLNSGPHNLIENEEFRTLWQMNTWKSSVKCKLFVDDLCGHFRGIFAEHHGGDGTLRKDNWTLSILTRVMYHPAIGDAIDDDGSGYISVREFNKFLEQKPESWSVPELFAFWALGWQESIYNQTREINDIEWELEKIATQIKKTTKDEAIKEQVKAYLEVLDALTEVTNWYKIASYEDPDEEYGDEEMQKLKKEYNETNQKFFEKIVGNDGIVTDTESSLYELGIKFDTRVELWFIPLIYHVLTLQLKQANGVSPQTGDTGTETEDGDVSEGAENEEDRDIPALRITDDGWYDMCCTLEELLLEFHSRMKTLLRGWRMQRLNPELQINSFSGGIFAGWYEVYTNASKKDFITRLESIYSDDDDYADDDYDDDDDDGEEDEEEDGKEDGEKEAENVAKELSELRKQMSTLQASTPLVPTVGV